MKANLEPLPAFIEKVEAGDRAVREGDLTEARAFYLEAQSLDPGNLDAKVGLDYVAYLESGRTGRFDFGQVPPGDRLDLQKEENLAQVETDFSAGKSRVECWPTRGFIEHTTRCNFYCPHCTKGYEAYHAEDMSRDLVNESLATLLPRMTWTCITGFGEPTISPQYADVMSRLVENGVRPHFNTNTSTLTLPHIESLIRCDAQITLSIDGATRETFERIRAGGNWESLQYVLHGLRRLRSIYPGKGWFDITFVAMRANIHELPDIVRMAHEFGLDMVRVQDYHFHNIDFDDQSLRYEPERANLFIREASDLAEKFHLQMLLPPPYSQGAPSPKESLLGKVLRARRLFPKRNRFPQRCSSPWRETNIKVDGQITPCCFSTTVMGNLNQTSFEKIWNGFRYRFFRWRIQTAVPPLECRWCHVLEGINQGNPSNVLIQEGLLLKAFYYFENKLKSLKFRCEQSGKAKNYFKGKWIRKEETG